MTTTKLLTSIETGGVVETPPDSAGLFALALREDETYVFYEWGHDLQLAFEQFKTVETLLDRMQRFASRRLWRAL